MRIHGWTSSQILLARVAVFGALVAGALAGCGGGASAGGAMSAAAGPNAPLAIGQGNATATAAEAIVTPATLAETATTAAGASAAPAAVPPALSSIDRRVVQRWFSSQNVSPTAAGTVTIPCAVGGSFTAVTSADGKTLTVTFADCSEVAGTSVGGKQTDDRGAGGFGGFGDEEVPEAQPHQYPEHHRMQQQGGGETFYIVQRQSISVQTIASPGGIGFCKTHPVI